MAPAPPANKTSRAICMQPPIADRRFLNQYVTRIGHRRPADVVAWMGAVQAQEYEPAKWGLGLRMRDGAVDAEIDRAFEEGRILRTHVMRPTWHFVTPADIRWLLELTAPRVHKRMSPSTTTWDWMQHSSDGARASSSERFKRKPTSRALS